MRRAPRTKRPARVPHPETAFASLRRPRELGQFWAQSTKMGRKAHRKAERRTERRRKGAPKGARVLSERRTAVARVARRVAEAARHARDADAARARVRRSECLRHRFNRDGTRMRPCGCGMCQQHLDWLRAVEALASARAIAIDHSDRLCEADARHVVAVLNPRPMKICPVTVSYTHLTLPTICSV